MTSEKTIDFIAGLPRSGSTLLANILAQHPRVHVIRPKVEPQQPRWRHMYDDAVLASSDWKRIEAVAQFWKRYRDDEG